MCTANEKSSKMFVFSLKVLCVILLGAMHLVSLSVVPCWLGQHCYSSSKSSEHDMNATPKCSTAGKPHIIFIPHLHLREKHKSTLL